MLEAAKPVIVVVIAFVASNSEGNKQDVSERIVTMALNGSGVRDTSRVLGVSTTTVIAHLKKTQTRRRQPLADSGTGGSV